MSPIAKCNMGLNMVGDSLIWQDHGCLLHSLFLLDSILKANHRQPCANGPRKVS